MVLQDDGCKIHEPEAPCFCGEEQAVLGNIAQHLHEGAREGGDHMLFPCLFATKQLWESYSPHALSRVLWSGLLSDRQE